MVVLWTLQNNFLYAIQAFVLPNLFTSSSGTNEIFTNLLYKVKSYIYIYSKFVKISFVPDDNVNKLHRKLESPKKNCFAEFIKQPWIIIIYQDVKYSMKYIYICTSTNIQ